MHQQRIRNLRPASQTDLRCLHASKLPITIQTLKWLTVLLCRHSSLQIIRDTWNRSQKARQPTADTASTPMRISISLHSRCTGIIWLVTSVSLFATLWQIFSWQVAFALPHQTCLTLRLLAGLPAHVARTLPFEPVQILVRKEIEQELDALHGSAERKGAG